MAITPPQTHGLGFLFFFNAPLPQGIKNLRIVVAERSFAAIQSYRIPLPLARVLLESHIFPQNTVMVVRFVWCALFDIYFVQADVNVINRSKLTLLKARASVC